MRKLECEKKLSPQAQKVLRHLVKFGSITNVEAHNILKVRSLSRRITELREREIIYVEKADKRDPFGQRYVRYSLTPSEIDYAKSSTNRYMTW